MKVFLLLHTSLSLLLSFCAVVVITFFITISLTTAVSADPSTLSNWNCFAKMIITEIAMDNLIKLSSSSTQSASFDDAINYQTMTTGLSTFSELPCWTSNISTILELDEKKREGIFDKNENQYNSWQEATRCYGTECPPGFKSKGSLQQTLASAIQSAKTAAATSSSSSSSSSTLGFWLAMIAEMVASAHNPLQVCELFDAEFPNGDHSGKKFFVKINNDNQVEETITLSEFVGSAAGLLSTVNKELVHPIQDFPDEVTRLNFYASSLQKELGASVSPSERTQRSVQKWIDDSFSVCGKNVYDGGKLKSGGKLSSEYITQLRAQLQKQLLLAGYHLASVLQNEVFA